MLVQLKKMQSDTIRDAFPSSKEGKYMYCMDGTRLPAQLESEKCGSKCTFK